MKYGICIVSVAPMKAEAADKSEMVSQLLFGDKVEILKSEKNWLFITSKYDNYAGWIDGKMICEIDDTFYSAQDSLYYSADIINLLLDGNLPMVLPIGCSLPAFQDGYICVNDVKYEYSGEVLKANENQSSIIDLAKMFINTPYLWGGKSNFGIDCSGYVQQIYRMKNIYLPRDASQQAEYGDVLSFIEESIPGDLAFFDNEEGRIVHVGIMLENREIIHAHGKVRIDPIDSTGIFNRDSQRYSHRLRFIRRIIA